MSKRTSKYNFHIMEFGDIWYSGFDQMNMQIAENQMSSLYSFVGPGVYTGWEITTMYSDDPTIAAQLQIEKELLASAEDGSDLNRQYLALGSPNADLDESGDPLDAEIWRKVVRVTHGEGIVGLYRARTLSTYYFLMTEGLYNVWAEPSLSLATEGLAVITIRSIEEEIADDGKTFAYLGQVEVAKGVQELNQDLRVYIEYTDQRQDLKNLSGAFQQALKRYFYKHMHIGGASNPSQILLNTELTLNAPIPSNLQGSTVFLIKKSDNTTFTWDKNQYGSPKVLLNNVELPPSDYKLVPESGKIYLKNSLPQGSTLQLTLPLSPQKVLIALDINTGGIIELVEKVDTSTVFTWDNNSFGTPQVYLKGELQDASTYQIIPSLGQIKFNLGLPDDVEYTNEDLLIVLTALGKEIEGNLSGKRIQDLNAGSFSKGTLAKTRVPKIDHVGQLRLRETVSLHPDLRLFDEGDHTTYYPEIENNPIQFNTKINTIYYSQVFGCYLIGTNRGLVQTNDFINIAPVATWTPDMGTPYKIMDNTLIGEVHFGETYILTNEGKVYYTQDKGVTWISLKTPKIAETATKIIVPQVTAFWVSTDRTEDESKGYITYKYAKVYYMGTNGHGAFKARIEENQTDQQWQWSRIQLPSGNVNTTVYSLAEVCSLKTVVTKSSTLTVFERSVYMGTDEAFYVSIKGSNYKSIFPALNAVIDIKLLKQSVAVNNIIWRTNTKAFISHEADLYVITDTSAERTTTYYTHPLERMILDVDSYTPVDVATTRSSTITAIDYNTTQKKLKTNLVTQIGNITPNSQTRVLFTHFTDTFAKYNGVYVYDGDDAINSFWVRASDMSTSLNIATRKFIPCSNEDVWILRDENSTLDTSDLVFDQLSCKLLDLPAEIFVGEVCENPNYYQYWIFTNGGIYSVTDRKVDKQIWKTPVVASVPWNTESGIPYNSAVGNDIIIGSSRGLWKTTNNGVSWGRIINVITLGIGKPSPTIYDAITGENIPQVGNWSFNQSNQAFKFVTARKPWDNFICEKDYLNYYTLPWNSNSDVVVYENNNVVQDRYILYPDEGKIVFENARADSSLIKITIVRQGAFISDVGNTPHQTLPNILVVDETPVTTLNAALAPESQVISVTDRAKIPNDTEYLQLKFGTIIERVSVYVDAESNNILLSRPRTSTVTFPIDETEVFLARLQTVVGIEDKISISKSNQPYNLNSLAGANIIQITLAAKEKYNNLFDENVKEDNCLFAAQSDLDSVASSSSLYIGVEPSLIDSSVQPHAIYILNSPSVNGQDLRAGTDQGIWIYSLTQAKWLKESSLGSASRIYFLKQKDGRMAVGTDVGLWEFQGGKWTLNPSYQQTIYDYLESEWNETSCSVFGKDDGVAFIKKTEDGFVSNSFAPLDNKNVYGLFKGQFKTFNDDGSQASHDAMYLCTESGVYGITEGNPGNSYNDFIDGREMFGSDHLTKNVLLPNGEATTVPVKIYKIFQSPRPKSVPLILLTNNGIYRVRNWRWANPLEKTGGLNWWPEAHYYDGLSCYCYTTITTTVDNVTQYKMFVGTNMGVYRSYDEGFTWERCERINGNDVAVFDIQTYEVEVSSGVTKTCLMAATEKGIVTSIDDGDTWLLPGVNNSAATFNYSVSNGIMFERGIPDDETKASYLSQGFRTTNPIEVSKIAIYVKAGSYTGNNVEFTPYEFKYDDELIVDIT